MKIGDLVRVPVDWSSPLFGREGTVGIVIEVIDHIEVPPVVKVLWPGGVIDKEWTDELEILQMESATDIALVAIVIWGWAMALVAMSKDPNEYDDQKEKED